MVFKVPYVYQHSISVSFIFFYGNSVFKRITFLKIGGILYVDLPNPQAHRRRRQIPERFQENPKAMER